MKIKGVTYYCFINDYLFLGESHKWFDDSEELEDFLKQVQYTRFYGEIPFLTEKKNYKALSSNLDYIFKNENYIPIDVRQGSGGIYGLYGDYHNLARPLYEIIFHLQDHKNILRKNFRLKIFFKKFYMLFVQSTNFYEDLDKLLSIYIVSKISSKKNQNCLIFPNGEYIVAQQLRNFQYKAKIMDYVNNHMAKIIENLDDCILGKDTFYPIGFCLFVDIYTIIQMINNPVPSIVYTGSNHTKRMIEIYNFIYGTDYKVSSAN